MKPNFDEVDARELAILDKQQFVLHIKSFMANKDETTMRRKFKRSKTPQRFDRKDFNLRLIEMEET